VEGAEVGVEGESSDHGVRAVPGIGKSAFAVYHGTFGADEIRTHGADQTKDDGQA